MKQAQRRGFELFRVEVISIEPKFSTWMINWQKVRGGRWEERILVIEIYQVRLDSSSAIQAKTFNFVATSSTVHSSTCPVLYF